MGSGTDGGPPHQIPRRLAPRIDGVEAMCPVAAGGLCLGVFATTRAALGLANRLRRLHVQAVCQEDRREKAPGTPRGLIPCLILVGRVGIEPTTPGLKVV